MAANNFTNDFIRLSKYLHKIVPGKLVKTKKPAYLGHFSNDDNGLQNSNIYHNFYCEEDTLLLVVDKIDTDLGKLLGNEMPQVSFVITTIIFLLPSQKLGFYLVCNGNLLRDIDFLETFELIE